MIKVYVIIVTYNGMKWIGRCLNNLAQSDVSYEAIIIDNNSNDGTYDFIKQNYDVTLIKSEQNLGFARANNIGIKAALQKGAEFVFLLNQDCYVESNTISKLMEAAKSDCRYGIISPVHLNGVGDELDFNFRNYLRHTDAVIDDFILGRFKKIYVTKFVNAAAWMITRECLERVGGFDTMIFFHYGEDNNYCHRVLFHQLKIGILTDAFVRHDRKFAKKPFNYARELTRSKIPIFDVNLSRTTAFKMLVLEELKILRKVGRALLTFDVRLLCLSLKLFVEIGFIFFSKLSKDRNINRNTRLAWLD